MEQQALTSESEHQPSKRRRTTITGLIAAGVLLLLCILVLSWGGWMMITWSTQTAVAQETGTAQFEATAESATVQFEATADSSTATADAQVVATSTARVIATSTQQAYGTAVAKTEATGTAQVAQATAGLPSARLESDYSFYNSLGDWPTQPLVDEGALGMRSISDGIYRWEMKALQQAFTEVSLTERSYKDLYLSVDVRKIKGQANIGYGLLFRVSPQGTYIFEVVENRFIAFFAFYNEQWHTLWYHYRDVPKHGEVNTLAAHAEGNRFTLFVNGEKVVGNIQDSHIESGGVGLFVTLDKKGDECIMEFENFTLLVP